MPMKVEPVEELKLLRQIHNMLTELRKELQGSNKQMMERDDKRYELLLKIAETVKTDMQATRTMLAEMREELQAIREQPTKRENERHKRLKEVTKTGEAHRFSVFYWVGLGVLIGVLVATLGAVLWIHLT
jgi:uncharacterized membrane protein YukC